MPASTPFRAPPLSAPIADDLPFDEGRHLALEPPERTWSLDAFGYGPEVLEGAPFPLAISGAFRMLSEEGLEALRNVVGQLEADRRSSDRIANFVRGGVYRSAFLRGLCASPVVTDFVSSVAGAPVLPHTMPLYQGHINLMPDDPTVDVDRWHTDTVALDWVLLISDRATFDGGQFEYFECRKELAAQALTTGELDDLPRVQVSLPEAGYALIQQGNLVMHRARRVTAGHERTTLVNSYVPKDPTWDDVSRLDDCKPVDPPEILFTEWARHKAHRAKARLQHVIDTVPFTDDRKLLIQELEAAIYDVQTAVLELRDDSRGRLIYYGGDALTDPQH